MTDRRPLSAPALLGIVGGILLVLIAGLLLLVGVVGFLLTSMGPNGAGSGWPLLLAVGLIILGVIRVKLSMGMYDAIAITTGRCVVSAICSAACATVVLLMPGAIQSWLWLLLAGLCLLEMSLTIGLLLAEPRRIARETESKRLRAEGMIE